ncbi:hypothetical protein BT69DRAFT_1275389, partial [Atractiella rhizophila]
MLNLQPAVSAPSSFRDPTSNSAWRSFRRTERLLEELKMMDAGGGVGRGMMEREEAIVVARVMGSGIVLRVVQDGAYCFPLTALSLRSPG